MSAPHVIVGTAGHIDHGKTSLVRQLTGVDTDRLPEEKRRGITIVLGFAPLVFDDGRRVGLVDVPGHERFVKNMVAGAGGIDVALMVVAADEGVMPQTREHLEICQLLGIQRGMIALTKIDRARDLAELAADDVRSEFAGSFLEKAPIIPCSSVTGEGIDLVRATLRDLVESVEPKREKSLLLPIDRRFSVKGFGSIITGTIIQGRLAVGDAVEVLPPIPGRAIDGVVRVRSIQVFGDAVDVAHAGQRTAVNLQGVDLDNLTLGQVLAQPNTVRKTRRLGVQIRHLKSRKKKLKTGAKFLLHTGTALVEAAMTLLDQDALEPGESGFATIRLAEPIATLPGQRFIARGFEATDRAGRTIAGGVVVDQGPGRRRRKTEATIDVMQKLLALVERGPEDDRLEAALVALVCETRVHGIALADLAIRLGYPKGKVETVAKKAKPITVIGERAVDNDELASLSDRIVATVASFHKEFPFRKAIAVAEIASRLDPDLATDIVARAAQQLVSQKKLVSETEGLRAPTHKPRAEADPVAKEKLIATLAAAGFEPPSPAELEEACGVRGSSFKELLAALVRSGEVVSASPTIHFAKSAWERASAKVLEHIGREGEISTAQAKELLGISRKFLIPLLEAMDKHRITVRVGEVRKARR